MSLLKKYPIKIDKEKIVKIPFDSHKHYCEDLMESWRNKGGLHLKMFSFDKCITKVYQNLKRMEVIL